MTDTDWMKSPDMLEKIFGVEKDTRKLVTDIQLGRYRKSREYREQLNDIAENICTAKDYVEYNMDVLKELGDNWGVKDLSTVSDALEHAFNSVVELLHYSTWYDGEELDPLVKEPSANEALDKLEEKVKELTGKGCRYRVSNRVTGLLNDLASCIHRIAEFLSEKMGRKEGKCLILRDGPAKQFCLTWDRMTDNAIKMGLYVPKDCVALKGWVLGDKAYLRVGYIPGHRALVDLAEGKLHYYDRDRSVNKTVAELLEEYAGLSCRVLKDGVVCTGISEDNMEKVAKALAMPTSMDRRLEEPSYFWPMDYLVEGEKTMDIKFLKQQ